MIIIISSSSISNSSRIAHLSPAELGARRATASSKILAGTVQYPGHKWYVLLCPCNIDCGHMPPQEVPRITLSRCHYPGELDYFFTQQPFFSAYKFKVRWHCDECHAELDCGTPFLTE